MTTDLRATLETIRALANSHLQNQEPRDNDWIVLAGMLDHAGAPDPAARDKIVMTIFNLTREAAISTYQPVRDVLSPRMALPPLYLDVHLRFAANFAGERYGDGLAALSRLIGFFQQTPYLTRETAPQLPPEIDRITLEFENLSLADVREVTEMLGTPYQPSIFYKLRMLPFAATGMPGPAYPITELPSRAPG
jgi:hypothetical protein